MATVSSYRVTETSTAIAEGYTNWLRLFNVRVTPLSDLEVAMLTADAIRSDRHIVIADQNLHGMYLSLHDQAMRSFFDSVPYVYIDGMGLVLLGNLLGIRLKRIHRATSLDFMPILLPIMVREAWRLFYLGGRPGIASAGAAALRQEYPGLQIRSHHGYLSEEETPAVIREINEYRPHILLVGLGMPLQEKWIQHNRTKVDSNVIIPVGAFMDYKADVIPTAPRWLALFCLEWMYRLVTEPRRLWHRYLIEPWMLMAELMLYPLKHGGSLTDVGAPQPLYVHHEQRTFARKPVTSVPGVPARESAAGLSPVESGHAHRSAQ